MNFKKFFVVRTSDNRKKSSFTFSLILCLFALITSCASVRDSEKVTTEKTVIHDINPDQFKTQEILDLTKASIWSSEKYNDYTFKSFSEIPKFDDTIDLNNVDIPFLEACIFYELNRRRDEANLPGFLFSPALSMAAKEHSNDMVALDFYSHSSPISGKEDPKIRLAKYGIKNAYIAENIAMGFGLVYQPGRPVYTPEQNESNYFSYELKGAPLPIHSYKTLSQNIVESWMNTISIRKNILNPRLIYTGIGVVHYKDSKFFNIDKFKITQKLASEAGSIP